MRDILERRCERFIQARDAAAEAFRWDASTLPPLCAALMLDQAVTAEKLRQAKGMIKDHTGVFSNFRGTSMPLLATMLAASGDPAGKLDRALAMYGALKECFSGSEYLSMAAMFLADYTPPGMEEDMARRTRAIYRGMRQEHPLLTSSDDVAFAAMMAMTGAPGDELLAEAERCYDVFHGHLSGETAQAVSHVLALGEERTETKCERAWAILDGLKARGIKVHRGRSLAAVIALALLPEPAETLAEDLAQVDVYLREQKGYRGWLGVSRQDRSLHAGLIVAGSAARGTVPAALTGAAVGMIAAEQAAMAAAMMVILMTSTSVAQTNAGGTQA